MTPSFQKKKKNFYKFFFAHRPGVREAWILKILMPHPTQSHSKSIERGEKMADARTQFSIYEMLFAGSEREEMQWRLPLRHLFRKLVPSHQEQQLRIING